MSTEMNEKMEVENVSPVKEQPKVDDDSMDEKMSKSNEVKSNTPATESAAKDDNHTCKFPDKEKLCTPAIQKLRKGLAEFDVRSPSDSMMSPVTAKLSQVRHTMKQSDAIRRGRNGDAVRKNPAPTRLTFEEDE
uniref:Uncharacterized protein n=1 Tax=Panagrolaimus davidi TaxID=227884 RepID=A0A914QBH9_9BILA